MMDRYITNGFETAGAVTRKTTAAGRFLCANKSCLQKAKSQTRSKNKAAYYPHIRIQAAKKYIDSPSGWESIDKLRAFVAQEEREIDARYTKVAI